MPQLLEVAPVTRIEGHLSIRVEVENGAVSQAWTTGESYRGFESILVGRHPVDAQQVTQRICGVCPVEHGIASVLAQDAAYGVTLPENGRLLRNLVHAANFIQSHILHFYLLSAIDFIDITAVLAYRGKDATLGYLRNWVAEQVASDHYLPAAPFLPRFDADYIEDLDINLGAIKNYVEAMEMRSEAARFCAMFGGKLPHVASLMPGGATQQVDDHLVADAAILIAKLREFIERAYLPDVLTVAAAYPQYFSIGQGCGDSLAYGVFAENAGTFLPGGVWLDGSLQDLDPAVIAEDVGFSLFSSGSGLHPSAGETVPDPDKTGAYTWLKAPRYGGRVVEVGPLARMMAAYQRNDPPQVRTMIDSALAQLGRGFGDLFSVMGRHLARAVECKVIADRCQDWNDALTPGAEVCSAFTVPQTGAGVGLTEAARGALGHWLQISGGNISRYQCVVPTTWNCSPRDDGGTPGAMEQALVGTPVSNPDQPFEATRVVRSFDPCLSCAVH